MKGKTVVAVRLETLEGRILLSGEPLLGANQVPSPSTSNVSVVRLWDGEAHDSTDPAAYLLNTFGGNPVQGIKATVATTTDVVHTGARAYDISTNGPIAAGGFDFIATSLTGFYGGPGLYVDTRDITPFSKVEFWLKNDTGSPFTLTFEIKDYSDSNGQRASRSYIVDNASGWAKVEVPLNFSHGWKIEGSPDMTRAKLFALVIKADQGSAVNGHIYVDDMNLVEKGGALDPATAPINQLVTRIARRQFNGLWGSRDRTTGFLPAISSYADVLALNSTAGLVEVLPEAVAQGWVTRKVANNDVRLVVESLNTMMDQTTYLPPRYADRVTLAPNFAIEESPVDAAFMFLALYQYKALPGTSRALRTEIQGVLDRFNFEAFSSDDGWKLGYLITDHKFKDGTYDGYSGEPWVISLAADLATNHHVDITTQYNSGINRVKDYLVDPANEYMVHTQDAFRAPFLQWIFPLFVDVAGRGKDTYPDGDLATNPYDNAVLYQKDVDAKLAELGRDTLLQPDAADDGTGHKYEQFSLYNNFGEPDLFMPWSVAFSFLGDPGAGEAALRNSLAAGLHGPLGLSDTTMWPTGQTGPESLTARQDYWNLALSTMAFTEYLYGGSRYMASLPAVDAALDKVFTQDVLYFDGKTKATFTDADGDRVTVSLKGAGHGTVVLPAGGSGNAIAITLDGTTKNSSVKVSVKGRNGTTSIGSITANSALGSISGGKVDLLGNIDIQGSLRVLKLHDVADQHTISIGTPANSKTTLAITLNRVQDLSIYSGTAIRSISVFEWLDRDAIPDVIDAPSVGSIKMKGLFEAEVV
jgi:hypothetical protein